jgi:oligopeptidase B
MSNPSKRTLTALYPYAVSAPRIAADDTVVAPSISPSSIAELSVVDPPIVAPPAVAPPIAAVVPRVDTVHGDVRVDEYFWLRDRSDPEVIAYLEAENRHAEAAMAHTAGLQERLFAELAGRIEETDLSVPEWRDGWFYYLRIEQGQQYPLYCRRRGSDRNSMDGAEEILLDQNELAEGHGYFRVGVMEVSPGHGLLAYSVDTTGAEDYTLFIKDLATGALLPESIGNTSYGVEWANDDRTLFYTTLDSACRSWRLSRHRLGSNPADDAVVYEERDPSFFVSVSRSKSGAYLLLEIGSHTSSEVRVLAADDPDGEFRIVEPRRPGIEYDVVHHGDRFYIVTNDGAPNFRLVSAPVEHPSRDAWTTVLPYRPEVKLDGAEAFRRHLVVYEREHGLPRIQVLDLERGTAHQVEFPEPVYTIQRTGNPDFEAGELRFQYSSLVTPASVIDYDMDARRGRLRKRTEVRGGYDASAYRSERLFATAGDGAQIPVSLVYRASLAADGPRPLMLYGYGSYGSNFDPAFSSHYLSLLDRGFVVAIAHVRGGEELGRGWYDGGRLLNKRNTFTDFIAAAEHLVAEGWTAPERLAINGGSAGGLLMGAVANLRPDLFRAVLADVPFVDVVNTMLDASLPLTVIEYEEWGDPRERAYYDYMMSYSPYDNVEAKAYPHLLITAGLNDPRVAYWEPAKWAARLRARKTDDNRLLLKTHMGAGHNGSSGRYDYLREVAFKFAFVLDVVQ